MATKLTRQTHKIAIQLQLVSEGCAICSSRFRRPVWKLLNTPSYLRRNFSAMHGVEFSPSFRRHDACWIR